MKKPLIVVFAALVACAVSAALPAAAAPIQSFCTGNASGPCPAGATAVDWDVCYDTTGNNTGTPPTGPGLTGCAAGTSDTSIAVGTPGVPVRQWQITKVPSGSRPALPITYTPGAWGFVAPAPGAVTGNVTAETDIGCNAGASDILASNPTAPVGGSAVWPQNGWTPFDLVSQTVPPAGDNAYVSLLQPMPSTFTYKALDRGDLTQVWLGGSFGPLVIPPTGGPHPGTPLQNLYTNSPYMAGLEASFTVLGADLNPPDNMFICRDTPQNSVVQYNQTVPPTAPGFYPRWMALTSSPDIIDGTVTRVLITRCVTVGSPAGVDTDGDCLVDSAEAGAGATVGVADTDGDLIPDGVEVASGTSPALQDVDNDGSSDYQEMFEFSNPAVADTDGDGSLDKHDDLSGMNCYSGAAVGTACNVANLGDTVADDNCPVIANPSQENSDSAVGFTNTPNVPAGGIYQGDVTNPHQDSLGDACDADADNDGLSNIAESGFLLTNLAPGSVGGPDAGTVWCLALGTAPPAGGVTTVTTGPLNPDDDSDGGLDGMECEFGSSPKSASATSCNPGCVGVSRFPSASGNDADGDLLFPSGAETAFRTQGINKAGGGQLDDIEQPGSYGSPIPDTKVGPNDPDADGDLLNDGIEVKFYLTSPANFDTDGDGCSDGREAADVNGDHKVASPDSLGIAQHTTTGSLAPGKVGVPLPLGSPNGAYLSAGVRRTELAAYDVNRDGKIDSGDSLLVSKLTGNCAFGVGAQTAKPIENSAR